MHLSIYHNPSCSKSRKALSLIKDQGIKPEVILYLKDTLSSEKIKYLGRILGLEIKDILRVNEKEFKTANDLPDLNDNDALSEWLEAHPKVIERPIIVNYSNGKAVIARPPENLFTVL